MTPPVAASLAASTAVRVATVDALALLAATAVAISVVGVLAGLILSERSVVRPYRLATVPPQTTHRPSANPDVRDAA